MNPLATAEWLISVNRNDDAKKVLDVMKPYCKTVGQIDAIGKLYADIREFNDCLELALKIYDLVQAPIEKWDARVNIIRACLNLNKPYQALKYISINEAINPRDHPNRMDKAMAYFLLNKKQEGEDILRSILKEPTDPDIASRVQFNLGTYELANGHFKPGLRKVLLDGRKLNIWHKYSLPAENMWEGGIQPGRTVLLCAEGGIGDEIISVRFHKHLREAGMNPIWFTDRKDLAAIFRRCGVDVITSLSDYKQDWLWCYSMPTPSFLDLEESQLWYGPYIQPLRQSPKLDGKLKIGIKCMGNPKYDQDLHRTIPYREVLDSLPSSAAVYSFHVDEDIPDQRAVSLRDRIKTWDDTLDYLDQMDLVISSCTSLAHAAAAMGKRSVVMVPILNYYTWARPTRHSAWYSDSTTVLRQSQHDNWDSTIGELRDYIHEFCLL
jgi:hypothetical protein